MKQALFALGLAAALAVTSACGGSSSSPSTTTSNGDGVSNITTLQITDGLVGSGVTAVSGKTVTVHYTGWLYNATAANNHGAKFDSSVDRGQPFSFLLGAGQVIKGWDQGVAGMKVGGTRTLIIPPSLGYGAQGAGSAIPPNATLVFDVQLLGVN